MPVLYSAIGMLAWLGIAIETYRYERWDWLFLCYLLAGLMVYGMYMDIVMFLEGLVPVLPVMWRFYI